MSVSIYKDTYIKVTIQAGIDLDTRIFLKYEYENK